MSERPLFDTESESESPRKVLSVTQLNLQLRRCLQDRFASVWVAGEISDLARPASGHIYLSLKDDQGQLRGVIWKGTASRLRFDLEDGMQVICEGQIDVYPPRGSYQLIIRQLEPQGIGALQLALNQLRERLQREGLFDPRRKRTLPAFPQRVAVITSPTGAAIRDFLEVHRRRWSGSEILVIPTRVQGAEAASEVADALELAQQLSPPPDVIVITRGGGSLEDLWCFNDERVVRAVAQARIPVVSAIGHEIDVTLCDLAADVRALTPSEAAERIAPSRVDLRARLERTQRQLAAQIDRQLQLRRVRLDALAQRRAVADPLQPIRDRARRTDELEQRLQLSMQTTIRHASRHLQSLGSQLEALSPLAVLNRGYSLTQRAADNAVVRSARDVQLGETLRTRLQSGELVSTVTAIEVPPYATPNQSDEESLRDE